MVVVRNLEITHRVDGVVHEVDDNVKATKVLIEDVGDNVKGIEGIARSVDNGTPNFCLSSCKYQPLFPLCPNIATHELKRLSLPETPVVDRQG